MSEKLINFNGITTLDIPADRVLREAIPKLKDAVIIGFDNEGEFYFASSKSDGANVLWLLEVAKKKLIEAAEY